MSKTPKAAKVNWRTEYEQALVRIDQWKESYERAAKDCNEAKACLKAEIVGHSALENACELNLAEFLKADSALKSELLQTTVLREEVENLKADLAEYKSACEAKQEQIEGAKAEIERLKAQLDELNEENDSLTKSFQADIVEWERTREDLSHSDAERRMLERDVIVQRNELARLQPFNIRLTRFAKENQA